MSIAPLWRCERKSSLQKAVRSWQEAKGTLKDKNIHCAAVASREEKQFAESSLQKARGKSVRLKTRISIAPLWRCERKSSLQKQFAVGKR